MSGYRPRPMEGLCQGTDLDPWRVYVRERRRDRMETTAIVPIGAVGLLSSMRSQCSKVPVIFEMRFVSSGISSSSSGGCGNSHLKNKNNVNHDLDINRLYRDEILRSSLDEL